MSGFILAIDVHRKYFIVRRRQSIFFGMVTLFYCKNKEQIFILQSKYQFFVCLQIISLVSEESVISSLDSISELSTIWVSRTRSIACKNSSTVTSRNISGKRDTCFASLYYHSRFCCWCNSVILHRLWSSWKACVGNTWKICEMHKDSKNTGSVIRAMQKAFSLSWIFLLCCIARDQLGGALCQNVNTWTKDIMSITRISEKDGSLATLTGLITNLVSFPDRPWHLSKK